MMARAPRLGCVKRRLARDIGEVETLRFYRGQAARLLRDASRQLGRIEARGEAGWKRLTAPYRRDAKKLLDRLERAVRPRARKKATRQR